MLIEFSVPIAEEFIAPDRLTLNHLGSESNPEQAVAESPTVVRFQRETGEWFAEPGDTWSIDQTLPFILPPNPTLVPPGLITGTLT